MKEFFKRVVAIITALIVFVNLLLFVSVANAEITDTNEKFTLLCKVEKSTGFNWKKGDWYQTNFKAGEMYIIKKHDKPLSIDSPDYVYESGVKNSSCRYGQEKDGYSNIDGCYSIKEIGEKSKPYTICREYWPKGKQLKKISCNFLGSEWDISPNEWFHRTTVLADLDSEPQGYTDRSGVVLIPPGQKDSLVLSVGRCSEI
jgi:hypothetical protein